MILDIDIYRSVNIFSKQHGDDASVEAEPGAGDPLISVASTTKAATASRAPGETYAD